VVSHTCKRFKQTGSMKVFAGNYRVSVNGLVRGGSIKVDQLEVQCVDCGGTQMVDRQQLEKKGRFLVRKTP